MYILFLDDNLQFLIDVVVLLLDSLCSQVSRLLYIHGLRSVEPEGCRRASKTAGERRRRGRVPPGTPGTEERGLRPSARRALGQERRGEAVGSESAGRRDGNARIGGGAEAEAKDGSTARCVRGVVELPNCFLVLSVSRGLQS